MTAGALPFPVPARPLPVALGLPTLAFSSASPSRSGSKESDAKSHTWKMQHADPRGGTSHPSVWARDLPPRPRAAPPPRLSFCVHLFPSRFELSRTSHWTSLAFPPLSLLSCCGFAVLVLGFWLAGSLCNYSCLIQGSIGFTLSPLICQETTLCRLP